MRLDARLPRTVRLVPPTFRGPLGKWAARNAVSPQLGQLSGVLLLVLVFAPATNRAEELSAESAADVTFFQETVAPILERRCLSCHNPEDPKGGLSLADRESALRGGDSGEVIFAGDVESSYLVDLITPRDGRAEMPKGADPLSESEVGAVRRWIAEGVHWPAGRVLENARVSDTDWWSLQPLVRPDIPEVASAYASWVETPVDAFVLEKLLEHGLTPSPPAERATLIRRLYFDLIGLPPSPEEISRFVEDADPLAYERLVDRLLESPHYGERWARHWLDVVHYGDTHGYDKDKLRPHAWPYRDYVIRAFNADKPYGQFIRWQLAGDVLEPENPEAIVATGFIAAGPWDFIGHVEVPESKIDGQIARSLDRDDMVRTTMETFNSVTVGCARCHHHKFDPVTQQDYYSLQAVFAAVDRADRLYEPNPEVGRRRRALLEHRERLVEARQRLHDVVTALSSLNDCQRLELVELETELSEVESHLEELPGQQRVFAAGTDFEPQGQFQPRHGKPREIRVLHRGNITETRDVARPGVLSAIVQVPNRFPLADDHSEGERRAALAEWLTDPNHPLTWRSMANRVWLYHFGRGIVDSPNDFGRMGQLPTHPELLDWLACELRDGRQSLKSLHRIICRSAVYRQSSAERPECAESDGGNQWYWRMNRRRLEAEAIRDAVLSIAGKLDRTQFGPGFQDFVIEKPEHSPHYKYDQHDPDDPRSHRRSIYRFIVRSQQQPFMSTLDCADPSMQVDKRNETVTALQALALLNNRFMLTMSRHFADRIEQEADEPSARVERAFELAMGRVPESAEREALVGYAEQHGLANLCRVVLNLNEFIFVD